MNTPSSKSIEEQACEEYLEQSTDETEIDGVAAQSFSQSTLLAVEGFEERSVGFLELCATQGHSFCDVVLARYDNDAEANAKYRVRFEKALEIVTEHRRIVYGANTGQWVLDAVNMVATDNVILDITGVSNRSIFSILDAVAGSGKRVSIVYSEAGEYWPKRPEWEALQQQLCSDQDLAQVIDQKPWLFGSQHKCELVAQHEGYDSAGTSRAMLAFLPYKPARLAAVMGEEEYSFFLFIAGRPRLATNQWRLDALKLINADVVRHSTIVEMDTFGYRRGIRQMKEILFVEPGLLHNYDVHMAIMGSKLQALACWVISCLFRSITVVTSVPTQYYPEAFSSGIGKTWMFPLTSPIKQQQR